MLIKSYQVFCEGMPLSRRRGEETQQERTDRGAYRCKIATSDTGHVGTARRARQIAKQEGWVRHREEFTIIDDAPSAGSTKIAFDLCPVCAGELLPKPSLPVRTEGEAAAVAGLAANRETASL